MSDSVRKQIRKVRGWREQELLKGTLAVNLDRGDSRKISKNWRPGDIAEDVQRKLATRDGESLPVNDDLDALQPIYVSPRVRRGGRVEKGGIKAGRPAGPAGFMYRRLAPVATHEWIVTFLRRNPFNTGSAVLRVWLQRRKKKLATTTAEEDYDEWRGCLPTWGFAVPESEARNRNRRGRSNMILERSPYLDARRATK